MRGIYYQHGRETGGGSGPGHMTGPGSGAPPSGDTPENQLQTIISLQNQVNDLQQQINVLQLVLISPCPDIRDASNNAKIDQHYNQQKANNALNSFDPNLQKPPVPPAPRHPTGLLRGKVMPRNPVGTQGATPTANTKKTNLKKGNPLPVKKVGSFRGC